LLERGGMEDVVDTAGRGEQPVAVPDVAHVETHPRVAQPEPQGILLGLVPAEHAHVDGAGGEQAAYHGLPERAGTPGDQEGASRNCGQPRKRGRLRES